MARHKVYSVTWDQENNRTMIEVEGIIEPVRNGDEIEYHKAGELVCWRERPRVKNRSGHDAEANQ